MTRGKSVGAVLIVLVVLVVGGYATVLRYNALNGPEQAVLDYAGLLADGRADAATQAVPPPAHPAGAVLEPALLTDVTMARATERIRVVGADIAAGSSTPGVGGTQPVVLRYWLHGRTYTATLRVRRLPDSGPAVHRWEVVDPLLVPVSVETNLPGLVQVRLAQVEVPVHGLESAGFPQPTPLLSYPGIFPLAGDASKWVEAPATTVTVAATAAAPRALAVATYDASDQLDSTVTAATVTFLYRCVAEGQRMDTRCPTALQIDKARPSLRIATVPRGLELGSVASTSVTTSAATTLVGFSFTQQPATYTWGSADTSGPLLPAAVFGQLRFTTLTASTPPAISFAQRPQGG